MLQTWLWFVEISKCAIKRHRADHKGTVKEQICDNLPTLMLIQTCMTSFLLWNIKEDFLKNVLYRPKTIWPHWLSLYEQANIFKVSSFFNKFNSSIKHTGDLNCFYRTHPKSPKLKKQNMSFIKHAKMLYITKQESQTNSLTLRPKLKGFFAKLFICIGLFLLNKC